MRELDLMAEAREKREWERASWIMCTIANFAFGNDQKWKPEDFNPTVETHEMMTLDELFDPLIKSGAIEVR